MSSGAGVILIILENFTIKVAFKITFQATNNEAEYKAIIAGLKLVMAI